MKPARDLQGRLADLEAEHRAPSGTEWLTLATDVELEQLEAILVRTGGKAASAELVGPDRERLEAIIATACARMEGGKRPFRGSAEGEALRETERRIYWDELLPNARARERERRRPLTTEEYFELHAEARRLAADRRTAADAWDPATP